jgi:hypothetical protein
VCGLLVLVVQVGLVARAQILLTAATREAARVAAVDPDRQSAIAAGRMASGLDQDGLQLTVSDAADQMITVRGSYPVPVAVPFLGIVRHHIELVASLTVRSEQSIPALDQGPPE